MALQLIKDTAISYTVQVALDAVKSCLQIGVGLFRGAKKRLEKIEDSLVDIHKFIVIAERSPIKDPELMKLLEKLKDAAYDAQDLLEEYEIADRRRSEEAANSMPAVRDIMTNKVREVVTSVLVSPIIMRKKLKEVNERLEAIKAEAHEFQLEEKVNNLQIEFQKQRETYSAVDESRVFGRDEEKEKIVNWLRSIQAGDHENVLVISIVGIGGIGKTTLAKLVSNHERVQNHFELRMWICVSNDFDIIRLGNKIIEDATDHNPKLSNVQQLQRRLRETLSGKKFLLVLDDVWNEEEPEKWYKLRDLLLCGGRGSRIIVTTRIPKVASIMSNIQPHILKPLSEDGCWSLFCLRAFGNPTEAAAHPNLAPIGRDIVKKCGGIPLAVTTLGGLLCSERSQRQWEFVRDSEMWSLSENKNGILPALRLSYNHLKPHLRQCFAFCAIFPQDYVMKKELVIKLWMAQGFIPTKRGMELEDTGDEIFDELVMKSFFQDVNAEEYYYVYEYNFCSNYDCCRVWTTFRMHDLMHDLAHSVMENELVVHNCKFEDISPRIRHVSSYGLGILAASLPTAQILRTYVMLGTDDMSEEEEEEEEDEEAMFEEEADFQLPCDVGLFNCLRALDFKMQRVKEEVEKQLLASLGNFQHLRYLNLSHTLIEMLPESLLSLCYLQTLILRYCKKLRELPKEMCKLTDLRCLDINHCDKLTHMPPKMGQLSCLQELSNFIVGRTNENACSGIGELKGLNLRGRLEIRLLENITDAIDVPRDNLINFPCWMMDTLTELVVIKLSGCWRCNHLPPLGELRCLKALEIDGFKNVECIGNEFYGNEVSGGFPSLEKLEIHDMEKLKTWSMLEWKGERVFPSLLRLAIWCCPTLTTVEFFNEDQIRSQSSLQDLIIEYCDKLIFSGLGLRYLSSLKGLVIVCSNEFVHMAHELSFLTSLRCLRLDQCHSLNSLPEGIGNLTSLRYLDIYNFPKMASLPRELQRLSALKRLAIDGCHPSLKIRCTKDTGEDWDQIKHIPLIKIGGHRIA